MSRSQPQHPLIGRWTKGKTHVVITSVRDGDRPIGYHTDALGNYTGGRLEEFDLTGFRRPKEAQ